MTKEITILAFNLGHIPSGREMVINGPGIDLYNFLKILKKEFADLKINLFTKINPKITPFGIRCSNIYNHDLLINKINSSDILHHWSGSSNIFLDYIKYANEIEKPVIVGPNVLDSVDSNFESSYLSSINFHKIFCLNLRIKYSISNLYNISLDKIDLLKIGPDTDLWKFNEDKDNFILWKGNSKHYAKDVDFALSIKNKLKKYSFKFLGYPKLYDYFSHIDLASRASLYICSSISETKSNALLEQWAAGCPSITHPKIEMHGKNYETGIIVSRDIDSYCSAIDEFMNNDSLKKELSFGCRKYVENNFNSKIIFEKYLEVISEVW